jgi:hypothetical protein
VRLHPRASVLLSALALSGALVGCSQEAVAPEQGVDPGTEPVPTFDNGGETGSGEGGQVGVDGTETEEGDG